MVSLSRSTKQSHNTLEAGYRIYDNLIEKQGTDSHKDNSFDKLHIHTLKGSTSLKLLHVQLVENSL